MALLRSDDTPAPASLHQWLAQQSPADAPRPRSRVRAPRISWGRLVPVATTVLAAAVVVLVLVIVNGGPTSSPGLHQATTLALSTPTSPAPAEIPGTHTLDVSAGGVRFPYWAPTVGWQASGQRTDTISGRSAITVFYRRLGHTVGYTIVTGDPLPVKGGQTVTRGGVTYTFFRQGPARSVTWVRGNHTCVIAGNWVSNGTLLKLATADIPA
jgi:hypothetical protein